MNEDQTPRVIEVPPGLEGVIVCATGISEIQGSEGTLSYRGVPLHDIAGSMGYEELVPWLVGIPKGSREEPKPAAMEPSYEPLTPTHSPTRLAPMETLALVMLTVAPLWSRERPETVYRYLEAVREHFGSLIGHPPDDDRGPGSARYLATVVGTWPSPAAQRAFDAYWVMAAEHGLNASTFAVRVAASTGAALPLALIAGVAALSGPLHGGAPEGVLDLLDDAAADPEHIRERLQERLDRGDRLMGFGHRVYKWPDPRALLLRAVLADLTEHDAEARERFELALQVEQQALALLRRHKPHQALYANVEFYAAAVLSAVGVPKTLCPATFALARTAGWAAHYAEQRQAGRLIRPLSRYVPVKSGIGTHAVPGED